ncbi:hypothetical protein [Variovorax paradoxus]|uniref:hypothetical protein n=1 Tax=Variovorax paradoxus TaxID=34073 RepID=UPI001ABC1070
MSDKNKDHNDLSKFAVGIRKSGFPLEYQTALTLKEAGWTVISSKYYLDDTTQTPREIDLIAYKVREVSDFSLYTTLIVSCKKSENDTWALLSRDADHTNPNTDWWPLHLWSNKKAINLQIGRPGQKQWFHRQSIHLGVSEALRLPSVELFAFQVMNSGSGAVQNDKPIYDSIASLVQAQAYEMSALPERRKEPAVYQFNLLTVVDAGLIRLHFDGAAITPTPIESEHYVARYIVQKRQSFSRIHFVKSNVFKRILDDYNRLHTANCTTFLRIEEFFYENAVEDSEKVALFIDQFRATVSWYLEFRIQTELNKKIDFKDFDLSWSKMKGRATIDLYNADDEILDFLNKDEKACEHVSERLIRFYRYSGSFEFIDALPF